ncbi:MAG: aminoglycoside phosphotransferase family protein [Chloroflexi bacterium]|nr:aminoglycoside phosphotransferase family protein [Chloroflexota bacterium]
MTRLNIEDHDSLRAYLRGEGWLAADETPGFTTLAGGVSNRTVLVHREHGRGDWVIKQALAKLRVDVDWFSAPERIQREAAALQWLGRIIPDHVPAFVFLDDRQHILAMSAVRQPHINWKTALLQGRTDMQAARQFGTLLAQIHSAKQPMLETDFADRRYFEELRLEPYYSYTAEQLPQAADFLHGLIADTRARRLCLVHGDYSPKNALVGQGRLIILDFEVTHFGDPAFDIGFSMTHLLSKAHHLPAHRSAFIQMAAACWRSYIAKVSLSFDTLDKYAVRHTCACLLARVAGRSPLEYLDCAARQRQADITLGLLADRIGSLLELIHALEEKLAKTDE